jgi:hypothetical protein
MMMWLGWLGALIVGWTVWTAATSASVSTRTVQGGGALLLSVYAMGHEDYPVLVLALWCAVSPLIASLRRRRAYRRARGVDVMLTCDSFERARRAVKDSVSTHSL